MIHERRFSTIGINRVHTTAQGCSWTEWPRKHNNFHPNFAANSDPLKHYWNTPSFLWIWLNDVTGWTMQVGLAGGRSKTWSFAVVRLAGIQKVFVINFASFNIFILEPNIKQAHSDHMTYNGAASRIHELKLLRNVMHFWMMTAFTEYIFKFQVTYSALEL